MELINSIPVIGPFVATVLPFLICLSIVVAIHELGHLMVGRWCGIKAEVYSVGFGRVLFSRRDSQGTVWQIALWPLGGFVKFVGDMDPSSSRRASDEELPPEKRPYAFHNAALWKRTLTVAAGPAINFLLSMLIFFFIALSLPKSSNEPVIAGIAPESTGVSGLQAEDRVLSVGGVETPDFSTVLRELQRTNGAEIMAVVERDGQTIDTRVRYVTPPRITGVSSSGAAMAAGIIPGDMILAINGEEVASSRHLILMGVDFKVGEEVTVRIDRDGELMDFSLAPRFVERAHPDTGELMPLPTMGVMLGEQGISPLTASTTLSDAAYFAVTRVWSIVTDSLNYMNQMLFKGATTDHLSGPIGIANHSADAAKAGVVNFIMFIAFVSTAIGFMNLLPIPILDGGHLMFYLAEAISGRPANETVVRYGTLAGFSLLILLMVFVTFNNDLGLGELLAQN